MIDKQEWMNSGS